MTTEIKSIKVLRHDYKLARDRFDRAKTYDNALALQKAKNALNAFFKGERVFLVLHNDNPQVSFRDLPTHWRIIDGGGLLSG